MSMLENIKASGRSIPFRNQLRTRLVVSFVALVVISIAIVTGFTLYQVHQQSAQQTFNQLELVAQIKENQITRWLATGNEQLHLIYSDLAVNGSIATFLKADVLNVPLANSISGQLQYTFAALTQAINMTDRTLTEAFVYNLHGGSSLHQTQPRSARSSRFSLISSRA